MIIYKCLISGDEVFSDIYKIIETEDGLFYEVEGKVITRSEGDIDDSLIGGNASAEGGDEGTISTSVSGVDIVLNHHLQIIPAHDKKSFQAYVKQYMKALLAKLEENNPEKVDAFKKSAPEAAKKLINLVAKNKDLETCQHFYTGENMNSDGIMGFLDYREDGVTPFFLFLKDGLEMEKC